jgi:hypothetical protein
VEIGTVEMSSEAGEEGVTVDSVIEGVVAVQVGSFGCGRGGTGGADGEVGEDGHDVGEEEYVKWNEITDYLGIEDGREYFARTVGGRSESWEWAVRSCLGGEQRKWELLGIDRANAIAGVRRHMCIQHLRPLHSKSKPAPPIHSCIPTILTQQTNNKQWKISSPATVKSCATYNRA